MRKITLALLALILLSWNNTILSQEIISGKVKVKLKSEKSGLIVPSEIKIDPKGFAQTGIEELDQILINFDASGFRPLFPTGTKFEKRHKDFGLDRWFVVETKSKDKSTTQNIKSDLDQTGLFEITEYYYSKKINVTSKDPIHVKTTFNDPRYNEQWHYQNTGQTGGTAGADISLHNAWGIQTGSNNVIVAVIDGGIDTSHVDLQGAFWENTAEINGLSGVDDDGNGYIDDRNGYNFGDNTGNINKHNHGTHVGGTIGAINNNGVGVSGVAGGSGSSDGVRLMSCATFGDSNSDGFDVAFVYAADNGAVIAQNSWGYTSAGYYEQSVLDAIDYFIANAGYDEFGNPIGPMQGGIVIFAAGNDNDSLLHYPGCYEPVLSVASTNHNDQKSWYSNYGSWVDIAAPGGETNVTQEGVLSTLPNNSYGFYQGTSMACPHVSGIAALIVSEFGGNLSPNQVWDRLVYTTDDIESLNPSYNGMLGSGRVNAFNTLQSNDSIPPNPVTDLTVVDTGVVSITLEWTATGSSADSGTASIYDLRYAEHLIDSANFNEANVVSNIIDPSAAGTTENFEVTGLTPNTTYYFALKAEDFFGNSSTISNVVYNTTNPAPTIEVTPSSVAASVDSGQVDVDLTISNTGDGDLEFTIDNFYSPTSLNTKGHKNSSVELIKGQKDLRMGSPVLFGQGDDGVDGYGYSWIDSNEPNGPTYNWIDISGIGTSISLSDDNYSSVTLPFVFPFYGEDKSTIYISSNGLLSFNSNSASSYGNQLLPNSSAPNDLIAGLWRDLNPGNGGSIHYHTIGDEFIVQFTNVPPYGSSGSYTFQYILNRNGNIKLQYASITGSTSNYTVGTENSDGTNGLTIAFNTPYITDNLAILISEKPSIITSASPSYGIIASGNSTTVTVTLDAADLPAGDYTDQLMISSNDPLNPSSVIPVSLHVNGIPEIAVDTNSISFGETFKDYVDSLVLNISNPGTDSLVIYNITSDEPAFYVNPKDTTFTIKQKEYKEIFVYFNPTAVSSYSGNLSILNNGANDSLKTISLSGSGVLPPVISINPDTVEAFLFTDDTISQELVVGNITGGSDLNFRLITENTLLDTTSIQYYTTSGDTTYHIFRNLNQNTDSLYITVTINGDYTSSSEYATLYIEETDYGRINNAGFSDGTDFVRTYAFDASVITPWLLDNQLDIKIGNSLEVNPGYGDQRHQVQLQINDQSWYTCSITDSSIAPSDSVITHIFFNAQGLFGGDYKSEINIENNDPSRSNITVPVILHVTGIPKIKLSNDTIHYGQQYVNYPVTDTIVISNEGTDSLIISNLNFDNSDFSSDSLNFGINPTESFKLPITYLPSSEELDTCNLLVYSNDSNHLVTTIKLFGNALNPPVIDVDPDSISEHLMSGDSLIQTLTIDNSAGNSDLIWELSIGNKELNSLIYPTESKGYNNNNELVSHKNEKQFPLAVGDFISLPNSPAALTCLTSDPNSGYIYGQHNGGTGFYRYKPETDSWETLQSCPLNSGNNGGATYLNGKIYTCYTGNSSQIGVYNINTNTWSTIPNNLSFGTANITNDGTYIYLAINNIFRRFNPLNMVWETLANPTIGFQPWGGLNYVNGFIYGHEGNGRTAFAKYEITSNTWYSLNSAPSGAVIGGAIDPVDEIYYTYGSYSGNNWYAFDLKSETWSVSTIPFFSVSDGGMAYVGLNTYSGIYFIQGEDGMGFAKFETLPNRNSNWLNVSTFSDTIPAGNSQLIDVLLNAKELNGGNYSSSLNIKNNDPSNPEVTIPVKMRVTGIPELSANTDSIQFNTVFTNYSKQDSLTIQNTGTDSLFVNDITFDNPDYTVDKNNFVLLPDELIEIKITYSPLVAEIDDANLFIHSNDTSNLITTIKLIGEALEPPLVSVHPDSISVNLFTGDSTTRNLTIRNLDGGSILDYDILGVGSSKDTTSTKYYTTTGETTNHIFTNISENTDSIYLRITLDGDYDYSSEYASLLIEGTDLGRINESGFPNNTQFERLYKFGINDIQSWVSDNILEVYVINSTEVNPGYGNQLNEVQLTTNGANWLTLNHNSGTIAPEDSVSAELKINATGLFGGDYNTKMKIKSNDPVNPVLIVPVHLNVTPIPMIEVSPLSLDFGEVYTGQTKTDSFMISNVGTDTLFISNIASNNSAYPFNSPTLVINPMSDRYVTVTFSPLNQLTENGIAAIASNDPDQPLVNVSLTGYGLIPPQIVVSPDTLHATMLTNSTKTNSIIIDNSAGGSQLEFEIEIQQDAYDSTSTQSYTTVGETTVHSFSNFNSSADSIELVITLNGDYTTSGENASLSIEGTDLGIINETNFSDGTDFTRVYSLGGQDVQDWLMDNLLEVSITNSSQVDPGYGDQIHQVQLIIDGFEWLSVAKDTGTINAGNLEQIDVTYNTSNLEIGEYRSNMIINSNDPTNQAIEIPVILNVVNNRRPVLSNPISDQLIYITEETREIDITNLFSDPDGDPLVYNVQSENLGVAVASLSYNTLSIDQTGLGSTRINISVTDGVTEPVETGFNAIILNNTKPDVITNINDQLMYIPGDPIFFNLDTIFSDTDDDILNYHTILSDSNVINTSLSGSMLTINPLNSGYSIVTLYANDGKSQDVSISFKTTVNEQLSPVIVNPISDQNTYITESLVEISIDDVFSDPNGDELTYTIGSSDHAVSACALSGNKIILTPTGVGYAVISLTASDGITETTTDTFNFAVNDNSAPVVTSEIEDQTIGIDDDPFSIDLNEVFDDPDNDPIHYAVETTDSTIVLGSVTSSTLTVNPVNLGSATITVYATDGKGQNVKTSFKTTVVETTSIEDMYAGNNLLLKNYPNPFSDRTRIVYHLNKEARVQLKVYTLEGKLIKILVDEYQSTGDKFVDFEGTGLTPGIYLYQLQIDNKLNKIKKMIKK